MISFVNFARVASICAGFHLGTLQGYFFHQDLWSNLNFPLEYQIILVLIINGKQAINMPKKVENIPKFYNHNRQLPVPFTIYADFEAVMKKVQGCRPNNNKSYTKAYQTHEDCGYGSKVVCCYKDKYGKPIQTYRGENAVYNSWKRCLKKLSTVRRLLRQSLTKHW